MTEHYEDIIHQGRVVGRRLVVDAVPDVVVVQTRIARDDFIERFTPREWLAGQKLAQTDANLAMALAILMGKPDGMVDPSSQRVARALGIMVQLGVLTPARAAAIGAV